MIWHVTSPDGSSLEVGSVEEAGLEARAARRVVDTLLDQYRQIEGREVVTELEDAISDYVAARELEILAHVLTAYEAIASAWGAPWREELRHAD